MSRFSNRQCLLAGRLCTSPGSPAGLDWDQHATDWTWNSEYTFTMLCHSLCTQNRDGAAIYGRYVRLFYDYYNFAYRPYIWWIVLHNGYYSFVSCVTLLIRLCLYCLNDDAISCLYK